MWCVMWHNWVCFTFTSESVLLQLGCLYCHTCLLWNCGSHSHHIHQSFEFKVSLFCCTNLQVTSYKMGLLNFICVKSCWWRTKTITVVLKIEIWILLTFKNFIWWTYIPTPPCPTWEGALAFHTYYQTPSSWAAEIRFRLTTTKMQGWRARGDKPLMELMEQLMAIFWRFYQEEITMTMFCITLCSSAAFFLL